MPLACFRGEAFFHYACFLRPSEVEHAPTRLFFKKEVFQAALEDCALIKNIVGRCCILHMKDYCSSKVLLFLHLLCTSLFVLMLLLLVVRRMESVLSCLQSPTISASFGLAHLNSASKHCHTHCCLKWVGYQFLPTYPHCKSNWGPLWYVGTMSCIHCPWATSPADVYNSQRIYVLFVSYLSVGMVMNHYHCI